MLNETLLMMPGPVPVPERVRRAMTAQAFNHRGPEFAEMYDDLTGKLQEIFRTKNDVYVISGSGTAGMEAAIANFCRGRKMACPSNGKFGERLYKIGQRYGDPVEIASAWGTPLDLERLESALEEGAEAVTLVHNETSTAIKNPAEEVGRLAQKHGALFILDAITSIGGDVCEPDAWGADITVVGSQKCLAAPAGLAAISVSERAWEYLAEDRPFYLDMAAYRKSHAKSQTPYTPAIPLFLALKESCAIVCEEGYGARVARHRLLSSAVRAAASAWGLELFATPDDLHEYSNTVTAIRYPDGITDSALRGGMKAMGVECSGGQDDLKGVIFRIGTMGATTAPDVLAAIAVAETVLLKNGYVPEDSGVAAAEEVLCA